MSEFFLDPLGLIERVSLCLNVDDLSVISVFRLWGKGRHLDCLFSLS